MEIRVNQQRRQALYDDTIKQIINRAMNTANLGINTFTFDVPVGLSTYLIIDEIRRQTKDTVYVPSRGVSDLTITFIIKD